MEVIRHARRRSKYHSLHHEELVREARERRTPRRRSSRRHKLRDAEEQDWQRMQRDLEDND
jgi:hypothetical protein